MTDDSAARPDGPTVENMRDAVAGRVRNNSLRSVAREIGMSAAGLMKFLGGSAPYTPTMRRLRIWYVRHAAVKTGEVLPDDAAAALDVLLFDLAPEPRRQAAARVIDAMAEGYAESGKDTPGWVEDLRALYAKEEAPPEPEPDDT